jgi:hypothetical protein
VSRAGSTVEAVQLKKEYAQKEQAVIEELHGCLSSARAEAKATKRFAASQLLRLVSSSRANVVRYMVHFF